MSLALLLTDLPGVYAIVNHVNGKVYVGSAVLAVKPRLSTHRGRLRRGVHLNLHLQGAWNKYGEQAFEFCILENCQAEHCIGIEQKWMNYYQSFNPEFGYNLNPIAGSSLGRKLSDEHKRKINGRGRKHSLETRAKIAAANRGQTRSSTAKARMSAAKRGKKRKPHSTATRLKMALSSVGRPKSPNHREALSRAKIGNKYGFGDGLV